MVIASGPKNPCPVCGRVKDSDCRITEDGNLVLCHTYQDRSDPINGFRWIGKTEEGAGWGKWFLGEGKNPEYRPQGKVFEFPYRDRTGVIRTTKKRMYIPGGKRDWWEPKGVPTGVLAPYRHAEAMAALAKDPTAFLFVDESEMTVDLLWDIGLIAIAFGRGFDDDQIREFIGDHKRRVVACCDQDQPGLKKIQKYLRISQSGKVLKPFPDSPLWESQWLPKDQGLDIRDWILTKHVTKHEILEQLREPVEELTCDIEALSEHLVKLRLALGNCSPLDRERMKSEIQAAKTRLSTAKEKAKLEQQKAREQRLRDRQSQPPPEKDPRTSFEKDWETAQEAFHGRLRYNLLKSKIEVDGEVQDLEEPRAFFAQRMGVSRWYTSDASVLSIALRLAKEDSYCPVKEYLESVQDTYPYPELLSSFAETIYGVSDPLSKEFFRVLMVGAVRRVFEPGCPHRYLLILQSDRQKVGKSTSLRLLFGDDFFGEGQIQIGNVDSAMITAQSWCHEIPEVDEILGSRSESALKFWISCQVDSVRLPYGRSVVQLPRRGVVVGTTNERELLKDPTGSSRYPIIQIPEGWEIPTTQIPEIRDSIWSAALAAYRQGQGNELSKEFALQLEERNQNYQVSDDWEAIVTSYVRINPGCTCAEILVQGLRFEIADVKKTDSNRVARILKQDGARSTRITKNNTTRLEWRFP